MRYIVMLLLIGVGTYFLTSAYRIVFSFGHMAWAERMLGAGGSYTAWRLIGVGCILGAIILLRYGRAIGL